ncbi:MAG: energy-coupling factor transporter ATP-binding protein EcfA2 [Phenylobacterium sp.]|jgi:energy-coupling factor transporter ATP-binding protein EcfA2
MKITAIHTKGVGPVNDGTISLVNAWTEEVEDKVLFTGPNGCGKSTVLRAVAMLWEATGYWLDRRKVLPEDHPARVWLMRWQGIAVVFDGIQPFTDQPTGLFFGSEQWLKQLEKEQPNVCWFGEKTLEIKEEPFFLKITTTVLERRLHLPEGEPSQLWLEKWSEHRKRMILTHDKVDGPNIIYFDAEERRWVVPVVNVSEPQPDVLSQRWLTQYIATQQWQGQIESSLITLKTTQLHRFHRVIKHLNEFLFDKVIETDIKPGEDRLRVKLKGKRGVYHSIDELSAGERQVLILIYLISRWMQPGGIVLIDEPDMFLHPSLVEPLLATLELIVQDNGGQLIITSHAVDVWESYESQGMRIEMNTQNKDVEMGLSKS